MNRLDFILEELVTANRILANEGIVDSFGHVSARHPDNPQHYLLSRARAPERIDRSDIVEYTLAGEAIDKNAPTPYMERFIHGAIYEARPEVQAVVHNHAPSVIPSQANRDSDNFLSSLERAEAIKIMGDVMRATYPPDRAPDPSL